MQHDTRIVEYSILKGIDGKLYTVFKTGYDAEISDHVFHHCPLACFDGYDNAYELTDRWWEWSGRNKADYI